MSPNSMKHNIQMLRDVRIFETLSSVTVDDLARSGTVRVLSPGQTLYTEGQAALSVNIVMEGSFRSNRSDVDGRQQVLCIERAGSVLGGACVFNGSVYVSTMVAEEQATVLCVEMHTMKRLCQAHPDLLWRLAASLADNVRTYAEVASMLSLRSVDERLALYLATIGQDRGVQTDEGCLFELTATRQEIAARLGSVREVVSRSLSHLQERGLITVRGRLIAVQDVTSLRRFGLGETSSTPRLRESVSSRARS